MIAISRLSIIHLWYNQFWWNRSSIQSAFNCVVSQMKWWLTESESGERVRLTRHLSQPAESEADRVVQPSGRHRMHCTTTAQAQHRHWHYTPTPALMDWEANTHFVSPFVLAAHGEAVPCSHAWSGRVLLAIHTNWEYGHHYTGVQSFRPFITTFSIEKAFINIWALTGSDLHKSSHFMSDSRHALPNASSVQTLRSTTAAKLNDPNRENKTSFVSKFIDIWHKL